MKATLNADFCHIAGQLHRDVRRVTFLSEHLNNLFCAFITEELTEFLFVKCNPMLDDEVDEIIGRISCQGRFAEMRIVRQVVGMTCFGVREVASAAAGDAYLLADGLIALEHKDGSFPFAGLDGTHESCRSCTNDYHVKVIQ
jgi:hypothetical protein